MHMKLDSEALMVLSILVALLNVAGIGLDLALNPLQRSWRYRLRRVANWLTLGIGYAFLYMGRYHLSVLNTDEYRSKLNISQDNLGWVFTIGYWAYSFSVPFTGYFVSTLNPKYVLMFGCAGSGLMNLFVGSMYAANEAHEKNRGTENSFMFPGFPLLCFFVVVNFALQGAATSIIPQINASWYKTKEAGNFSGVFSVLVSTGYFLALNLGAVIVSASSDWFFIFYTPAIALIVWNLVIFFVVDVREEDPVPSVEEMATLKNSTIDVTDVKLSYEHLPRDDESTASPQLARASANSLARVSSKLAMSQCDDESTASPQLARTAASMLARTSSSYGDSPKLARASSASSLAFASSRLISSSPTSSPGAQRNAAIILSSTAPSTSMTSSLITVPTFVTSSPSSKQDIPFINKLGALLWKNRQSLGTVFFMGYAKESLLTWYPSFLEVVYGCPPSSTIYVIVSCGLTLASMFGAMIVGIVSDKLFSSKRNPVYLLCGVMHTTSFFILGFLDEKEHAVAASVLLCFGGIWLLGGFSLVSFSSTLDLTEQNNASNNVSNSNNSPTSSGEDNGKILYAPVDDDKKSKVTPKKKDASSSVAFFACMLSFFQYMGSGLSGIVGAKVIGAFGFSSWCFMLSGVCLATVLPVLLLDDYVINIIKNFVSKYKQSTTTAITTTTAVTSKLEECDNLVASVN